MKEAFKIGLLSTSLTVAFLVFAQSIKNPIIQDQKTTLTFKESEHWVLWTFSETAIFTPKEKLKNATVKDKQGNSFQLSKELYILEIKPGTKVTLSLRINSEIDKDKVFIMLCRQSYMQSIDKMYWCRRLSKWAVEGDKLITTIDNKIPVDPWFIIWGHKNNPYDIELVKLEIESVEN